MKYGNFRPLLTSSQADMTLFVSGRGPHENTPIFDTWNYKKQQKHSNGINVSNKTWEALITTHSEKNNIISSN